MQTIKHTVRLFIQENFLLGATQPYSDADSFMDAHMLDSTGFLELVQFLEQCYGIKVGDEEMVPENLDSLDAIDAFISGKLAC